MGRNQKGTQESQNVKGSMHSGVGNKFCTSAEFLHHGAKFSHCGAKFYTSLLSLLLFFLCFYSFFLLILICNVEFDSNSSCLDRLDNLGINNLQKL